MQDTQYLGTERVGKLHFSLWRRGRPAQRLSGGHAKAAAPLSILRDVLLLLISFSLPALLGVTGIFWAAPAADLLAILIIAFVIASHLETAGRKALPIDGVISPMEDLPASKADS